jgi:multidrug resistance protein, MATE family
MSEHAAPLLGAGDDQPKKSSSAPGDVYLVLGRWPVDMPEAWLWWRITWTAGVSSALRSAIPFIDIAFLGHLSTESLSAASLANVWLFGTTAWLYSGQEEVVSTLVSQAAGHGNPRLAAAWLQLAVLLLVALCVPIGLSWVWAGAILRGLGFGPQALTDQAQTFCRWFALALLPAGLLSVVSAWLNALGSTVPPMIVTGVCVLVSAGVNELLIFGAPAPSPWHGLGFIGSPLSSGIVMWLAVALLLAIVAGMARRGGRRSSTRLGDSGSGDGSAAADAAAAAASNSNALALAAAGTFQRDLVFSRRNLASFAEQAAPSYVGYALETLQLQLLSGVAAHLGDVPLATHNALLNLFMVIVSFMLGALRGTSVRVGHNLGAGRVDLAKQTMWVSMAVTAGAALALGAVTLPLRSVLSRLFTDDPAVVAQAVDVFPLLVAALIMFSVNLTALGTLLGQARPLPVTGAALLGNWLVCIPLAFLLTHFTGTGLFGIWVALLAGYTVVTGIALVVLARTDWHACAAAAQARSAAEEDAASVGGDSIGGEDGADGADVPSKPPSHVLVASAMPLSPPGGSVASVDERLQHHAHHTHAHHHHADV